ncbi:MAG: hypothetical protein GX422_06065 [Deltaproteobacteria bacterium]|jgi:hypothetical protein|nr:hypothetical protein [Deltaproteobacteria bacterium]
MTFDDIKTAILQLNDTEKRRILLEIIPAIWSAATVDKACLDKMKELVDEAITKDYQEQHMGSV